MIQRINGVVLENNYKFADTNKLNTIRLFGVKVKPNTIFINQKISHKDFEFNSNTGELLVKNMGISLMENFEIEMK